MNGKPFLDTNIVLYAFRRDDPRSEMARTLLSEGAMIGVQVLNEFVAVIRRKFGMDWEEGSDALAAIRVFCPSPVPIITETHEAALRIAKRYRFHIFDSLMIAAALQAACKTLYSEDLQDGQVIEGLTIRNPFRKSERPQYSSL